MLILRHPLSLVRCFSYSEQVEQLFRLLLDKKDQLLPDLYYGQTFATFKLEQTYYSFYHSNCSFGNIDLFSVILSGDNPHYGMPILFSDVYPSIKTQERFYTELVLPYLDLLNAKITDDIVDAV